MHSDQSFLIPFLNLLCVALRDTLAESAMKPKSRKPSVSWWRK
jgi:hypothetical protein